MNRSRLKKIVNRILKVFAGIATVIVIFLATVFIVNVISNNSEQGKIASYGQLVPVDGKKMNVTIEGTGDETIVLLPGFGTAAPALDFKPLIKELSPFFKVVVIEPFGYGLSDETDKERTTENMVSEIHEALQQLNIHEYTLMGHSIAGIYGLHYVNQYPDEVRTFVGIDTSVPTQDGIDADMPIQTFKYLKSSGLLRLLMKVGADPYDGLAYDDQTKEQLRLITNKNVNNATTLNEMENFRFNFKNAEQLAFPRNLPVIFFVHANDTEQPNWIKLHEEQLKDSRNGKVIPLDGDHYLHHTRSKEMVDSVRQFLNDSK
ncbi:alpha/beta hydrolase [Brevibacillus reuszeri]|uniref:alpha/beta hydrolase n=1 Tax=Brevibacillus reuszeri TaxID=54915 RepID=UPI0035E3F401